MSGSNSICVATVLLETGIVAMQEPETRLVLEAPGGLIEVTAACRDGKAERISVRNLPSFADRLGASLELAGMPTLTVDTAFGGDSFVVVDAAALGFEIAPHEAHDLAELGMRITRTANEQIGFVHPALPGWDHISFCLFARMLERTDDAVAVAHAVAIRPGKIDRSPTGTAVSANMALLHARKQMACGDRYRARSIIGSYFDGEIQAETLVGDRPAIYPVISGSAWITGTHQLMLDPTDPWPGGYRLSDTWPGA